MNFVVIGQTTKSVKWEPAEELSNNATTEKEYNYLTKGLAVQRESGLDIISGYVLEPYITMDTGNYNFEINHLKRLKDKKIKAVSVVVKSLIDKKTYYYCVPVLNQSLMGNYMGALAKMDALQAKNYSLVMSTIYTNEITKNK